MPKIHDFDGFWPPKWSLKSSERRRSTAPGTHFFQRSLQDGFQTSFFMLLGAFFDVLGGYFQGFGLYFCSLYSPKRFPKHAKYFV